MQERSGVHRGRTVLVALAALAASIAVERPAAAQAVGKFPDPEPQPAAAPAAPLSAPPAATPAPAPDMWSRYPRIPAAPDAAPAWPSPVPAAPAGAFAPPVLPYRDGVPVPQGYRLEESSRGGLIAGGTGTLAGAYVIGLGFAIANDFDEGTGWLALPVFGPWVAIGGGEVRCNRKTLNSDCIDQALSEAERITFLTVDGLIQAVGVALVIVGVVSKHREFVRSDVAKLEPIPGLVLRPRSVGSGLGFGAAGVF
jgi:hypothetical protein